jgi:hypothetical protein
MDDLLERCPLEADRVEIRRQRQADLDPLTHGTRQRAAQVPQHAVDVEPPGGPRWRASSLVTLTFLLHAHPGADGWRRSHFHDDGCYSENRSISAIPVIRR